MVHGGKVFVSEKKIREFKKIFFKRKSLEKRRNKRIKPSKPIFKAKNNLNRTKSVK